MHNFRNFLFIFIYVVISTLFFKCSSEPREINYKNIQVRNGLYFALNEEKPFSGHILDVFNTGQKHMVLNIKNGLPKGKSILYYRNGMKERVWYINGFDSEIKGNKFDFAHTGRMNTHGLFISYYEKNGNKKSEGDYKNNKTNGKWIGWYENGQIEYVHYWKDGKKNKKWIDYFINGQISVEGKYINDNREGKWITWYENGQKQTEGLYKSDKEDGEWLRWRPNGKLYSKGLFQEGKKRNLWIELHDNGEKLSECNYINGQIEGKWTAWFNNGQKREEGNYISGEKHGKWFEWDQHGKKKYESLWEHGKLMWEYPKRPVVKVYPGRR